MLRARAFGPVAVARLSTMSAPRSKHRADDGNTQLFFFLIILFVGHAKPHSN